MGPTRLSGKAVVIMSTEVAAKLARLSQRKEAETPLPSGHCGGLIPMLA
jgi:hypothetical protein